MNNKLRRLYENKIDFWLYKKMYIQLEGFLRKKEFYNRQYSLYCNLY